jgi:LPXTG-site transpeptidase (sortase) family protein
MRRRAGSRAARALIVAAALTAVIPAAASTARASTGLASTGLASAVGRPGAVRPSPGAGSTAGQMVQTRVIRRVRAVRAVPPWTIGIPAIGVRARLVTLGVPVSTAGAASLLLPVPSLTRAGDAGWYPFTAVPGAAGNAVIAGHVDTYSGPAVFYNLYQLRLGDLVTVTDRAGRERFRVTSVRELAKPDFPVGQVFGRTARHTLWLITCGGDFNYETGHYLDNIVVSAAWEPVRKSAAKRHDRQIVRIKSAQTARR